MSKAKRKSTEPGKQAAGKCPRTEPSASVHAPGGLVAPGHGTVVAPGQTTVAPGQATVKAAPGQTTVAPGQATVKAAPGQTTVAPGHVTVKAAPGQTTIAPGQATVAPGQATVAPGQATAGQSISTQPVPIKTEGKPAAIPRLPSNPQGTGLTITNSVRPTQSKGQEPSQDIKAKRRTSLILTGTNRSGSSTADLQSEVSGPTKKTSVLATVRPQNNPPPFLNPVASRRSVNSTPHPALNHGSPSSVLQGPAVMRAQNVEHTALMPETAKKKKSLNEVIKQKASDLAKYVAKVSFDPDSSHRSSVSTLTPSTAKQEDRNRQALTEEKKAEPLIKREQKAQDGGTRFHRNVHRLLVHLVGAYNIGEVDQIEDTVQAVLESLGLPID